MTDSLGLFPGTGSWYGRWCGGGYSDGMTDDVRGNPPKPPIKWNGPVVCPIDGACRDHDACWAMCSTGVNPRTGKHLPPGQSESDCVSDCNHRLCQTLKAQAPPDECYPGVTCERRFRVYQQIMAYFCYGSK